VRRIVPTSLALVVLAAGAVAIAQAESGGPAAPITKAAAVAFAIAVKLRAGDLSGAEALPRRNNAEDISHIAALSCGRKVHSSFLGGAVSFFAARYGFVGSVVVVAPTDALAKVKVAALSSSRGRVCLARKLGESETVGLGESETIEGGKSVTSVTSHTVKATFVPVEKLLGPGAITLHVLAELPPLDESGANPPRTLKHAPKPKGTLLYAGATFLRVGPAEILLLTLGARRFPPATEGRLLTLLHSRAEANKL
jgi:hypothetical protein